MSPAYALLSTIIILAPNPGWWSIHSGVLVDVIAEGIKRYLGGGGVHVSSLILSPEVVQVTYALNSLARTDHDPT